MPVDAVYATVHATYYLQWASSHCARTSATANGDLARPQDLAQPKPARRVVVAALDIVDRWALANSQRAVKPTRISSPISHYIGVNGKWSHEERARH